MDYKKVSRYVILGILFFLPVTFLLMLYPATHDYNPLDIVNENVIEIDNFASDSDTDVKFKDHISVIGFFGKNPLSKSIVALNLKELIYDKFKGFKKFQIVILVPKGAEAEAEQLKKEISLYEDLKFWHFVYNEPSAIERVFYSLKSENGLDSDLSTNHVFLVDKEFNQRGRIDDREDIHKEKNKPVFGLYAYNCIEVAELKNKMGDDCRILLTEYRQKRKGEFNSVTRRASDLK